VPSDTCYNSVREILGSTLEAVQANYGAFSLISAENGMLQNYASYGSLPGQRTGVSVAHWVANRGELLVLETPEQALLVPDIVVNHGRALPLICVPIRVHGTTIGALQANFQSVAGHEELLQAKHTLQLAASLIGYMMENATLQRQLQEAKELIRQVNNVSLEIQEAERERIILEVHDGIAQILVFAFHYLQTVDNIVGFQEQYSRQYFIRAVGLIRQAIRETREIISSATPATLDVLGLVTTVQQELKQFQRETGCQVDFRSVIWPDLPRHMEFTIYRIIREAVNNVKKHAQSPRLEVELSQEQKWFVIRVKDWGIGFIPAKQELTSSNRCIGLISMRRGAELLGGTFKINSSLGKGTDILVDIPWLIQGE